MGVGYASRSAATHTYTTATRKAAFSFHLQSHLPRQMEISSSVSWVYVASLSLVCGVGEVPISIYISSLSCDLERLE